MKLKINNNNAALSALRGDWRNIMRNFIACTIITVAFVILVGAVGSYEVANISIWHCIGLVGVATLVGSIGAIMFDGKDGE